MSALKKDKQKVLGEFFDDTRIKLFLEENHGSDYVLLEKAYRGMIAENFGTFVSFFIQAGKDVNGKNENGDTFLQNIAAHRGAADYINELKKSGAH